MNQDLYEAYRQTTFYAVTPRGRLALRIGQCDAKLDALLSDQGCETWAYLTACNPGSIQLSLDANQQRQARLESELCKGSWAFYRGEGIGGNGDWPPEPSVLVLGIDEPNAQRLGELFSQNAIVVGCTGKPSRLVLLGCASEGA